MDIDDTIKILKEMKKKHGGTTKIYIQNDNSGCDSLRYLKEERVTPTSNRYTYTGDFADLHPDDSRYDTTKVGLVIS